MVVLGTISLGAVFLNESPHNFSSSECFGCHFTLPQPGDTAAMAFMDDLSVLCTNCHPIDMQSHVVGILPHIPMPGDMPTDDAGRITCGTCHNPHMNAVDPVTGEKTYFLRKSRPGKGFCLLCHEDPMFPGEQKIFSESGKVTHRRSMTEAHGVASFTVTDSSVEIDPLSEMCIGCHNESEAEPDPAALGMGIWDHGGGIGRSHPIGVNYDDAAWKDRTLVPVAELDRRIVLFDGKVGCCTCHNLYAEGGGMGLVIGDEEGYLDLCQGCHIK